MLQIGISSRNLRISLFALTESTQIARIKRLLSNPVKNKLLTYTSHHHCAFIVDREFSETVYVLVYKVCVEFFIVQLCRSVLLHDIFPKRPTTTMVFVRSDYSVNDS